MTDLMELQFAVEDELFARLTDGYIRQDMPTVIQAQDDVDGDISAVVLDGHLAQDPARVAEFIDRLQKLADQAIHRAVRVYVLQGQAHPSGHLRRP